MKKYLVLLLLFIHPLIAAAMDGITLPPQDSRIQMQVFNPDRDVAYTIGELVPRTVILVAKKPLTLLDTSLPITGYERRWKGQVTGIELRTINKSQSMGTDDTTYILNLSYQIFTTGAVTKAAFLPAEKVRFTDGKNIIEYRIPEWGFRISPIALFGTVKLEQDMSQYRGPLLLDPAPQKLHLKILLSIFTLSLLGLLYILGVNTWLPRMGGPFARAYRDLRKLPSTPQGLQQGVERLHRAFNLTAGTSVFNADNFIARKPAFAGLKAEMDQFFNLSRTVFFEPAAPSGLQQPEVWLRRFCLSCRNFERGMK
jgi:mxaA protein